MKDRSSLLLLLKYIIKQKSFKFRFESINDAFRIMPYGLNKKLAKGVDAVVQFELSGEEAQESYLVIRNQKCTFNSGKHPNPTLTVKADSKLWLDITNGDVNGVNAFINEKYEMVGNASIMLNFDKLFDKSAKVITIKDRANAHMTRIQNEKMYLTAALEELNTLQLQFSELSNHNCRELNSSILHTSTILYCASMNSDKHSQLGQSLSTFPYHGQTRFRSTNTRAS